MKPPFPDQEQIDREWEELLESLRATGMSDEEIDDVVARATANVEDYSKHPCPDEDVEDCDLSVGDEV